MDNGNELFPIVDLKGNVTGKVLRSVAHSGSKILHPVVHLHLFNSKGEVYLQHRPDWKDIQPGKWDTACGGHVAYGESIEEALEREVAEELGIRDIPMNFVDKYVFTSTRECELVHVHTARYDGTVNPDARELDGGRFFSPEEIESRMGTGFFTPNFESEWKRFSAIFKKELSLPFV